WRQVSDVASQQLERTRDGRIAREHPPGCHRAFEGNAVAPRAHGQDRERGAKYGPRKLPSSRALEEYPLRFRVVGSQHRGAPTNVQREHLAEDRVVTRGRETHRRRTRILERRAALDIREQKREGWRPRGVHLGDR